MHNYHLGIRLTGIESARVQPVSPLNELVFILTISIDLGILLSLIIKPEQENTSIQLLYSF